MRALTLFSPLAVDGIFTAIARLIAPKFAVRATPSTKPVLSDAEALQGMRASIASLLRDLDAGRNLNAICASLQEMARFYRDVETANELKRLQAHLVKRVHEESLPMMRDWRGRIKPPFDMHFRTIANNHAFAHTYGLPDSADQYPYVNQKAVVAALAILHLQCLSHLRNVR